MWNKENLRSAYAEVRRNGGAAGIDHISLERFGHHLDEELERLHQQLKGGTYQPQAARRHWIDKPGSPAKRPLAIPAVRDRVVEAALKHVIEPIFEREFADCSHGFRPGRGTKSALREVDRRLREGHLMVVEVDIQNYFESIDHDRLLAQIEQRISDGRVLELIRQLLKRGVREGDEHHPTLTGTPQGGVISPLLANLYLNELDHQLQQAGYRLVRYADDLVVLCDDPEQAACCLEHLGRGMEALGLQLHPEKTRVVDMNKPGAWFDFLGYRFNRTQGRGYLRRFVSAKSQRRLREKLRPYLTRCNGHSLETIIHQHNPILRGWYEYFKHVRLNNLEEVDGWVRMRLRSILRKRRKGQGRGRGSDHHRWPNRYFTQQGLFTLAAAHAEELQSSQR